MIEFEHYRSAQVFGIRYVFREVGDALPTHEHEADTAHNIIVLQGKVAFVADDQVHELIAGAVFDFDGSRRHTIKSIVAPSVILNLFLNGIPTGYSQLPMSERKGVISV